MYSSIFHPSSMSLTRLFDLVPTPHFSLYNLFMNLNDLKYYCSMLLRKACFLLLVSVFAVSAQSIDEEERVHVGEGSGNGITDDEDSDMEVSIFLSHLYPYWIRRVDLFIETYQWERIEEANGNWAHTNNFRRVWSQLYCSDPVMMQRPCNKYTIELGITVVSV